VRDEGTAIRKQLARRIRELRKALLYTQEELAERAGISVSFLSMIERAERVPHLVTLDVLARALGLTLSQMFVGLNRPRGDGAEPILPLLAYLQNLRLEERDVELLLAVARSMFEDRR
jgi:transcriptional regulator with XRE-family HTH domain